MGDCTDNTKPIVGSSDTIILTTTPQDLLTMLGATLPTNAKRALVHFNMAPAGKTDPIARMAKDINFSLSATEGAPIQQARTIPLTKEQFGTLFRSVSDTIDAFVEFFDVET